MLLQTFIVYLCGRTALHCRLSGVTGQRLQVHELSSVANVGPFFPLSKTVILDPAMPKCMSVGPCEVMVSEPAGSDKRY